MATARGVEASTLWPQYDQNARESAADEENLMFLFAEAATTIKKTT
jgi:hypothetical protein